MKLLGAFIRFIFGLGLPRAFVLALNLGVFFGIPAGIILSIRKYGLIPSYHFPLLFLVVASGASLVIVWKDRPRR